MDCYRQKSSYGTNRCVTICAIFSKTKLCEYHGLLLLTNICVFMVFMALCQYVLFPERPQRPWLVSNMKGFYGIRSFGIICVILFLDLLVYISWFVSDVALSHGTMAVYQFMPFFVRLTRVNPIDHDFYPRWGILMVHTALYQFMSYPILTKMLEWVTVCTQHELWPFICFGPSLSKPVIFIWKGVFLYRCTSKKIIRPFKWKRHDCFSSFLIFLTSST